MVLLTPSRDKAIQITFKGCYSNIEKSISRCVLQDKLFFFFFFYQLYLSAAAVEVFLFYSDFNSVCVETCCNHWRDEKQAEKYS